MKDTISVVISREILGPYGTPTIETTVVTEKGYSGKATVPYGMSVGKYEAKAIYDGGDRFKGRGVTTAVSNVNEKIKAALVGMPIINQSELDRRMLELDGTPDKSNLGANAILSVSLAAARAGANSLGIPLYRYLGGFDAKKLPVPMSNMVGGGSFYNPDLVFEDYLFVAAGFKRFREALEAICHSYQVLGEILKKKEKDIITTFGIYTPRRLNNEDVLNSMVEAIGEAGYDGKMFIGLDIVGDELYDEEKGHYVIENNVMSTDDYVEYLVELKDRYPIVYLEDPFHEEDFTGFAKATKACQEIFLTGDDLFATNIPRIKLGIKHKAANAMVLKPNQVGTLTEAYDAGLFATKNKYALAISMRSQDTIDSFIADLAVGIGADLIKCGPPVQAERTEKFNRLLEIEKELEDNKALPAESFSY